jgi:NTE family protein
MKIMTIQKETGRLKTMLLTLLMLLCIVSASHAATIVRKHATRPKVALVLGGGGAKGAAEVGVLKEIERAGVPIDYIVGTSIGSIIGGLYSVGYRADDLDSLFMHQDWISLFNDKKAKKGTDVKEIKGVGLMKGVGVLQFLDSLLTAKPSYHGKGTYPDSIDFNYLPIPYRAVACDIRTGNSAVLSHGSLPLAMRASMAIPGVFKPVRLDSLEMLDGGLVNNLPVDVARKMGADIVIAIDLTQNKHPDFTPKKVTSLMGKGLKWLRQRPDFVNYNRNRKEADIYINPVLKGYGVTSFKADDIRAMIGLGQEAAKKEYTKLVALKKKLQK